MIPKCPKHNRIKPRMDNQAIRRSAQGQACTLRLECCNGNRETTVLAHIRGAAWCGTGLKPHDLLSLYACSSCHDAMDGRAKDECTADDILRAHCETLLIMARDGLVNVKGKNDGMATD
jgi:hypothetical protein